MHVSKREVSDAELSLLDNSCGGAVFIGNDVCVDGIEVVCFVGCRGCAIEGGRTQSNIPPSLIAESLFGIGLGSDTGSKLEQYLYPPPLLVLP